VWFLFLGDGVGPFKRFSISGPLRRVFGCTFYGAAGLLITVFATAWLPNSILEVNWLATAATLGFAIAASAALRAWFLTSCNSKKGIFFLSVAMLGVLGVVSYLYMFASTACVDGADVRGSVAAVSLSPLRGAWNACPGTTVSSGLSDLIYDQQALVNRSTAVVLAFCALVSAVLGSLLNLLRKPGTVAPHKPARWLQSGELRFGLFCATFALPLVLVPLATGGANGPKTVVTELLKPTACWFDRIQPTYRFARLDAGKVRVNGRASKNSQRPRPGSKADANASPRKP
jgi:hypothetical protein